MHARILVFGKIYKKSGMEEFLLEDILADYYVFLKSDWFQDGKTREFKNIPYKDVKLPKDEKGNDDLSSIYYVYYGDDDEPSLYQTIYDPKLNLERYKYGIRLAEHFNLDERISLLDVHF